jgi:formylglycine-generating enzyme required for sulfatase activity
MGLIFISYRRDDTSDVAGRIDDRLVAQFGRDNVFKDVDSIVVGSDFPSVLRQKIAECAVVLVVIGRQWLHLRDDRGQRRLDNPADFVRIEIETALKLNKTVIPLLVQGATMAAVADLPDSLKDLTRKQGSEVRSDPYFHGDMSRLIGHLIALLYPQGAQPAVVPPVQSIIPPSVGQSATLPDYILPPSLKQKGFVGMVKGDVEVILPPLCQIAAGPFLMGSDQRRDPQAQANELPKHTVSLGAFQIARYPVTVAEYACAMQARVVREPPTDIYKHISWQQQLTYQDHPVVNVSWIDAKAYCQWLSQQTGMQWRLPTEAEWEKAARGTDGRIYPWGDVWNYLKANTNIIDGRPRTTTPIGSYADNGDASPYGVHDMAGNVWEWTSTIFAPYPYQIEGEQEKDADTTSNRIVRGGSWYDDSQRARVAYRDYRIQPDFVFFSFGFRLVVRAGS